MKELIVRYPDLGRLIASILAFLVVILLSKMVKIKAKQVQEHRMLSKSRYLFIKRVISFFSFMVTSALLLFIWGIDIRNIWVTVSGVTAMFAIAFFAVWSLIGNILAGILIYFTSPFKINDLIEVAPDNIKGTVMAINTFYTVLLDEDDNYINVPNSLFFQKYIKNYKKKPNRSSRVS